jgi:hypothetical protein
MVVKRNETYTNLRRPHAEVGLGGLVPRSAVSLYPGRKQLAKFNSEANAHLIEIGPGQQGRTSVAQIWNSAGWSVFFKTKGGWFLEFISTSIKIYVMFILPRW